jgi:hypothetical protein
MGRQSYHILPAARLLSCVLDSRARRAEAPPADRARHWPGRPSLPAEASAKAAVRPYPIALNDPAKGNPTQDDTLRSAPHSPRRVGGTLGNSELERGIALGRDDHLIGRGKVRDGPDLAWIDDVRGKFPGL